MVSPSSPVPRNVSSISCDRPPDERRPPLGTKTDQVVASVTGLTNSLASLYPPFSPLSGPSKRGVPWPSFRSGLDGEWAKKWVVRYSVDQPDERLQPGRERRVHEEARDDQEKRQFCDLA